MRANDESINTFLLNQTFTVQYLCEIHYKRYSRTIQYCTVRIIGVTNLETEGPELRTHTV